MNMREKTPKDLRAFRVFAIKEGTVIDHIDAGSALKIIRILNLADEQKIVSVGLNFSSKGLGMKDIIKVEKRELTPDEINRVAIFAPHATINIIRDFKVTKKFKVQIPDSIHNVIVCPNPKCVTNVEKITTRFTRIETGLYKCEYCEKTYQISTITGE